MRHDILKASTKYNDLLGSAAADRADYPNATSFKSLFQTAGLDFETYQPVAYSFNITEETYFPDRDAEPTCDLIAHCVKREDVEGDIEELADPGLGLPVHRFYLDIDPVDFLRLFKRFQITFANGKAKFRDYYAGSNTEDLQDERFL